MRRNLVDIFYISLLIFISGLVFCTDASVINRRLRRDTEAPIARGFNREIRRKPPAILQLIGPLAFGRKDGDDAKMHVPMLGQFGVGDVSQMTAKFTPEGSQGQKANGGTFDIDDEKGPQLGYMDRETTMGERSGSTGKMSFGGLGNIEMGNINEQGTGLLDFSKSLFPFLQLPALKNETENVKEEHTQVDQTYTDYYYPKPRSYLGSSYDINRPQVGAAESLVSLGKNREDIEFPKLVTQEPPKKYSNPFDSVQIRPRIHAAVTKTVDDKDLNSKEGFIAQNGKQVDPDEDTAPLLTAEHKVSQVTTRKSIHEVGLSVKEIYALCAKFAPMANQHCYKSKVEEQFIERCRGYQKDCVEFIAKARPLGAIANSFSSGVGLTYYDWNVNGIPYYPVNEEGSIGNGHHGKVDFGTWGGGYSDNLGVRDFWSQTQEYGANWYEGQYGYKTGWSIPIVQGIGVEGGQGTQVSVPIKEGELGRPISVTNGYHVGPFMGLADRVGVDWLNGGVSWNKGFAVPFVGVGVNTGTAVGFPSVGMIMNRMGMDGVETLNNMARAAVETLTQLCLDIVHMKITPMKAYERILTEKKDRDAISSELIDVLVLTEPESEFADNASTSKENFESFVNLLTNTIIPEEILRLELDCFKKDDHSKALIRLKTKVYFKQAKFNLFREESEGYSKLVTELMEAAESSANENEHAKILKHRVLSLIGQFNLDPNRVTDVILEVFENFPRQKLLFIALLKEIDVVRDYLCALLGFKFTFYQSDKKKKTPYSLYVLTASLIQHEMIDMMKILGYMIPKAEAIKEGHRSRMQNAQERASKAETISTASMPIMDSRGFDENGIGGNATTQTISFTTVIQLQEDEDIKLSEGFNEEYVLSSNQKLGLTCALLESGNWKQAQMLIDRLPEYYAVQASPRLCRALCKIIEKSINDFYKKNCSLNLFGDLIKSTKPVLDDMGNGLRPIESWEDLGKLSSVLAYLGPRIAFRASTNIKIVRLLTAYYRKVDKDLLPKDDKLNQNFVEVVSECLLPSLTLSETNVALSEEIWQLLELFPYSWRYWMYSKWNLETSRHPEMHIMKGKIHGRTKYVLKRLSKETVKMMGRQLGKLCHIHPSTVLSYLLSQVQTFDNFIGPVVDSLRYLTSLEFDVLTYCIISQLADPSKQALKSTDATISPWLQALGTLVGSLYRRYPLELNGMLDYVLNQLKLCKSYDMLLLREIIQNMSWIESISGATKEQIEALGGGDLLKQEAGGYSTATKNRKAAQRLRDALLKGDLAVGLAISVAQQKEHIVYNESSTLPLKLVGKMVDQCSDTFQQLVSFLSVYLKNDDFSKRVPTVRELLSDYSLGMEATMCLARPIFFSRISDHYDAAKKISKAAVEDGQKTRLDTQQKTEMFTSALESQVEMLMDELKASEPGMEENIPVKFFAVFWMLTMYDIEVPTAAYERTLDALKKQSREDSHGKAKKTDKQLESKLREEQKRQIEHVERCKVWLLNKKDSLIDEQFHNSVLEALIQQCLLPRAIFSELDAVFCGQFFMMLHEMRTPFFPSVLIIDRLFENIIPLIAGLTENEANSLACFFEILLCTVQRWHSEKEVFEKECAGFPGMITKQAIEYQTFRKLCYRWQIRFTAMFKTVFTKDDADYVLIRNSLIMMTKLTSGFPVISHAVATMETAVTKLKDREKGKRDDLSLKAASYVGKLKMRTVKIYAQNSDYAPVPNKKVSVGAEKPKKKEKVVDEKDKADGEPVDKKIKVDSKKNGTTSSEKVVKDDEVHQNGSETEKKATVDNKERKKRPGKSSHGSKESKKEPTTEDGEVKTPSPPPAKKTRIVDRLKRSDEPSKKDEKESPKDTESEKGEGKKRRERSKDKETGKEKRLEKDNKEREKDKERKRENGENQKEQKILKDQKQKSKPSDEKLEVAGPALPDPVPKKDDKKGSRKAIEFDLEEPSKSTSSSRKDRKDDRKEKKEELPKASRIAEPARDAGKSGRDRGHRTFR